MTAPKDRASAKVPTDDDRSIDDILDDPRLLRHSPVHFNAMPTPVIDATGGFGTSDPRRLRYNAADRTRIECRRRASDLQSVGVPLRELTS